MSGLRGHGKYPAQVKGVQETVSGLLPWQRYIVKEIRRILPTRPRASKGTAKTLAKSKW